jgi:hypothetical protein
MDEELGVAMEYSVDAFKTFLDVKSDIRQLGRSKPGTWITERGRAEYDSSVTQLLIRLESSEGEYHIRSHALIQINPL